MTTQNFFINKGAELPILTMEVIDDGRHDFNKITDYLQNSDIYFNMVDIETGVSKISHKVAYLTQKETSGCTEEYLVCYQFSKRETDRPGIYRGQFEIIMNDDLENEPNGNLIIPLETELLIFINDGSIKK